MICVRIHRTHIRIYLQFIFWALESPLCMDGRNDLWMVFVCARALHKTV